MLVENTALLEDTERFQVMGPKHKKASPENDVNCQPSKKTKEKQPVRYQGDIRVKLRSANLCERCVYTRQDYLVHNSR